MLLPTPSLSAELQARLGELDRLREELGGEADRRSPWMGVLRRQVRASVFEGSTSIEGFSVPREDAIALASGEQIVDTDDESRMAVACYARAMDHVAVMAGDPGFRWLERVVLDLHFDACYFQKGSSPGLWRTGPVGITGSDGRLVYEGPRGDEVPALMAGVVEWLESGDLDAHVVVRAAMAHLHVVSVHPFRDGNGRISRIVQSLVLAWNGLMSPEFGSIEEYLAEHTAEYYAALNEAHGPTYDPRRDVSGWVAFCVEAHIEQAAARWSRLEELVEGRNWPDRLLIALEQSLFAGTDRATYAREAEISPATASADFRRLLDAGLVEQSGQGRTTRYRASEQLVGAAGFEPATSRV